jgi:hypothetical protein
MILDTFNADRLRESTHGEVGDALECGRIPYFPESPVALPSADDLAFLREELPQQMTAKNVSYHPETDSIRGLDKNSAVYDKAMKVLTTHSDRVSEFYQDTMPELFKDAMIGTSSFRPIQEKGRDLKAHASNELIHFDAGAYGPTNGSRILRFFVNLNPLEDRVWATRGDFPTLFKAYAAEAGLLEKIRQNKLEKSALDNLRTGTLNSMTKMGLPLARLLDNSPYDRTMRQFHNFMKDTPAFQNNPHGREELSFPPFSAWTVFTDMVSHACLSGQHAFIWTAIIPLENCRHPEMAPINIMRNAA